MGFCWPIKPKPSIAGCLRYFLSLKLGYATLGGLTKNGQCLTHFGHQPRNSCCVTGLVRFKSVGGIKKQQKRRWDAGQIPPGNIC
jgi:hypothetical protein